MANILCHLFLYMYYGSLTMKINNNFVINTDKKTELQKDKKTSTSKKTEETPVSTIKNISDAKTAYAKAEINLKQNAPETKFVEILEKIINENEHIHRIWPSTDRAIRARIGREIEGFKGLHHDDKEACAYLNKNNEIEAIYIKDNNKKNIKIIDVQMETTKEFTEDEVSALKYYKHHPQWIHPKLRFNKDVVSGSFRQEVDEVVATLSNLFINDNKVEKNKETKTLYRALQPVLTNEEKTNLQTIGAIFTEKSFCSTTTDFFVAKRFAGTSPILEIEFPKDATYIDIEKFSNIDVRHFREDEYLLDKNSHFEVIGFVPEENIIKVKYLGSR